MKLVCPAAVNGGLPGKYQTDGVNPPLAWKDVPAGAQSLVLTAALVEESGRARDIFVAWHIRPDGSLEEGAAERMDDVGRLPDKTALGLNWRGRAGWTWPESSGPGVVVFTLAALARRANCKPGRDRGGLARVIEGSVIAETTLTLQVD